MKAYTKDVIKTIFKGMKRFMALALIAALGVCMMTGLKASCDDLRYSADRFFDKQNLFDVMVLSTMGLTDDDVAVLSKMDGIEQVEGAFSETVYTDVDGKTKQAVVNVLSEKGINVPYLMEGKMPTSSNEIVVTQKYLLETGRGIGDVIVIEEDMEEDEEAEEEDSNTEDSKEEDSESEEDDDLEIEVEEEEEEPNFLVTNYTIVGWVIDATDINSQEGAVSFRSSSSTDYTFFVLPEAVSSDIYTAVYITLDGTDELQCYSDEYIDRVDEIVTILEEEVKADREQARYDSVTGEALDKVSDAEDEMNEKFAEADEEIADAKKDIEDARAELRDGEKELRDGEKEVKDAEKKLDKAEKELKAAEKELKSAEKELAAGWKELEEGEAAIEEGEAELETAEKELDAAEKELDTAEAELDAAEKELEGAEETIEAQFAPGFAQIEEQMKPLEAAIEGLNMQIAALESAIEELTNNNADGSNTAVIEQKTAELTALKAQLQTLQVSLAECQAAYDALEAQKAAALKEVSDARAQIAAGRKEIKAGRKEIDKGRQGVEEGRAEIAANKKELKKARKELEKAEKEIEKGKTEIADGYVEIKEAREELKDVKKDISKGWTELADGKEELADGEAEYEESVSEYEDKKAEALDKIAEARQEIAELKMTEWYVSSRTSLSGYANIKTDAECIESIGNAFPILFLTVAILISLTTISRMVEEDRGLIGTYKALGFTDKEIRRKYMVYALLACIIGGILGLVLGFVVLPEIIFTVFGVMYQLPEYMLAFNWGYGISGILLFIVGIVGAAIVSCNSELSHMPAMLMRPKAPKNGSRVFLERITPIWKRLSFLNKVTARNLFRYKKRLFMTLFGIAGCTSILLAGFTIKDTITNMLPRQYEDTYIYDVMVVSDDNEKLLEYLDSTDVKEYINPMVSTTKVINADGREESIQLIVVPTGESIEKYITLVDREHNKIVLKDGMVVSTINAAEVQGYDVGDSITLQNIDLESAKATVTDITLNYLGNAIYMTENTYKGLFDDYEANGAFVLLNDTVESEEAYANALEEKDGILTSLSVEGFQLTFDTVFRIINLVVTIVITLAAALAFVVLFTLSTTNISERERELATIKVLGFFDREVHLYVNKETLILTSLGILLGMPLGKGFGIWLMSILKMPSIYFADCLYPISYLYAALIATTFAFIVNFITDKSLDKINPVEALKSIE